jgi:hypothetical protein
LVRGSAWFRDHDCAAWRRWIDSQPEGEPIGRSCRPKRFDTRLQKAPVHKCRAPCLHTPFVPNDDALFIVQSLVLREMIRSLFNTPKVLLNISIPQAHQYWRKAFRCMGSDLVIQLVPVQQRKFRIAVFSQRFVELLFKLLRSLFPARPSHTHRKRTSTTEPAQTLDQ